MKPDADLIDYARSRRWPEGAASLLCIGLGLLLVAGCYCIARFGVLP